MNCEKKAIKRARRTMGEKEMMTRRYHAQVRRTLKDLDSKNIEVKTFDGADDTDICILSRNEFDISEMRKNIEENNESYFINIQDYESQQIE
jgi:translation elongation factor P/translation initiation factor 5A